MNLDRHTYEAWLLDRSEGNLSPEQERQLDLFLAEHPELHAGADPLPNVDAVYTPFAAKDMLHRDFPPLGAPDASRLNDFLAARLEGDLSPEQEKQLDRYLYEHPEASRDAAAMAKAKVVVEPISLDGKDMPERHFPPQGIPGSHNLSDFLIAKAEGDLSANQQLALERYLLHHPDAQREQRLVAAARMQPAPLVFPWKKELRKREVRILPLWTRWAAAASIALLMGMGWWLSGLEQRNGPRTAVGHQPDTITTPAPAIGLQSVHELAVRPMPEQVNPFPAITKEQNASTQVPKHEPLHGITPTLVAEEEPATPVQPSVPDPVDPVPETRPERLPIPLALKEPTLAQAPPVQPTLAAPSIPPTAQSTVPPTWAASRSGQELGTFLANKLRSEVLETRSRPEVLDGSDVLAMADQALDAISNGSGGIMVQHSPSRKRIRIRLGRHFSISTSRSIQGR